MRISAVSSGILVGFVLACGGVDGDVSPSQQKPASSEAPPATEKKPEAPVPTHELLILYEDQSMFDAVEWIQEYSALIEPIDPLYGWEKRREYKEEGRYAYFGSGCPELVESSSIKGFKPGFHVVIGGVCRPDEAKDVLAKFKPHVAGAYLHNGQIPGDDCTCPDLLTTSEITDLENQNAGENGYLAAQGEARAERETIEYFHRAVPDDAADRFHIIIGSFEEVMEANSRMLEVVDFAPGEAHVFDSDQFTGLTDGYWIVSLAYGDKEEMLALCTKLKPQVDCIEPLRSRTTVPSGP